MRAFCFEVEVARQPDGHMRQRDVTAGRHRLVVHARSAWPITSTTPGRALTCTRKASRRGGLAHNRKVAAMARPRLETNAPAALARPSTFPRAITIANNC